MLRRFRRAALLLAGLAVAGSGLAQTGAAFSNRPLKIVVPFPAGGPVDLTARTLAQKLTAALGQAVIVDNRAGAATIIGTDAVAKAPADGYTWLITTNTFVSNPIASSALVRAGKLRALGTGGMRRLPTMPELPTITESGIPGFEAGAWFGLFAPAAIPRDIVKRVHGDTANILAMPEVRQTLSAAGAELVADMPEQFTAFVKAEIAKWAKVVAFAGVKAD